MNGNKTFIALTPERKQLEKELQDFERRTGFPKSGTRQELESIGARYLSTEPFNLGEETMKREQMEYESKDKKRVCMWKRTIPAKTNPTNIYFKIHYESTDELQGHKIYNW